MKSVVEFSSVHDWLHYFENRHEVPIQMGLERIKSLAEQLDLIRWNIPVITVAGTNGKGSTVASLQAIYLAAGYRVAAYTSPHLFEFNERITINQQPIPDRVLEDIFSQLHAIQQSHQLTYFEITTLAALLYFKQEKPDVIILEVGMGGRLDATNIIDATLAIITTIGLDHEAFLGHTIEQIATEKAGILRKNQLAIYGDTKPPQSLLDIASAKKVRLFLFEKNYVLDGSEPPLYAKAFAAAKMAVFSLQAKLPTTGSDLDEASSKISLPGRLQWLQRDIPTLVDVAHNPQAVSRLQAYLGEYLSQKSAPVKVHAIFSGLQDKKLSGLIEPMRQYVSHWYLTELNHARSATQEMLENAYLSTEHSTAAPHLFKTPGEAYQAALNRAKSNDIIIIYGSFLLVSAIMSTNSKQKGIS